MAEETGAETKRDTQGGRDTGRDTGRDSGRDYGRDSGRHSARDYGPDSRRASRSDSGRSDRRGASRSFRGGKKPFFKKKVCRFCTQGIKADYKNPELLQRFITDRGKILPRRITGTCARHQRALAREIKRARVLAYLPFVKQ